MVDSNWYIRQARNGDDPLKTLSFLAEFRDIATCGLIKAEVGRGLIHRKHRDRYQAAWEVMLYVDSDSQRWDDTLDLAWRLDRAGVVLPLKDIHIAVCADQIGAVILTYDEHFQKILGVDATDRIF